MRRVTCGGSRVGLAVGCFFLGLLVLLGVSPAMAWASSSTGDGGWFWQNPQPQGNDLTAVSCTDASHAWAVGGGGAIVVTSNGGAQWLPQASDTRADLRGVDFVDGHHGWAVGVDPAGNAGVILGTRDGGDDWAALTVPTCGPLHAVSFIDADLGWAVGDDGTILATSDGGAHWSAQSSPTPTAALQSVHFVDAKHGWAVGYNATNGAAVAVSTTDGGAHWTVRGVGTSAELFSVTFVDDDHGWIGGRGTIMATTDGGAHWTAQDTVTADQFSGFSFFDDEHGWAVGASHTILATTDGGAHWVQQPGTQYYWGLGDVAFADATHGFVVGAAGLILGTSDGGAIWAKQSSYAPLSVGAQPETLTSVAFADRSDGWAVGYSGALTTTDGGLDWTLGNPLFDLYSVAAPSPSMAAVAGNGVIATSADGGANWISAGWEPIWETYKDVSFPDAQHGWAIGVHPDSGFPSWYLATFKDGSWSSGPISVTDLEGVSFADDSHGWLVGANGRILATTGGRNGWSSQVSGTTEQLWKVHFVDDAHGWVVGEGGTILATTDGGANWSAQDSGTSKGLFGVDFINDVDGWVAGDDGTILATTDGGAHWVAQGSGTDVVLYGVSFVDADHGWVVGDNGTILATDTGGNPPGPRDTTPPFTTITGGDDLWHNTDVHLKLSATDDPGGSGMVGGDATTEYEIGDGPWTTGTQITVPAPSNGSDDGVHAVRYRSCDAAGNWETARLVTLKIDSTPPGVVIAGVPTDATVVYFPTLTLTAYDAPNTSDVASVTYILDGVSHTVANWTTKVVVPLGPDGLHTLTYEATDNAGNTSAPRNITIQIDTVAPVTQVFGADDSWHNTDVQLSLTATDDPGGCGVAATYYKVASGAWTQGRSVTIAAPADHSNDGAHTVSYYSTDLAGNTEAIKSMTVRIDTTPPAGGFLLDGGATSTTSTAVGADSSATDAHGPLEMRFSTDGGATWSAWVSYAATTPLTLPAGDGAKTVQAQYRDAAGNVATLSATIELTSTPSDTTPPTVTASGVVDGRFYDRAVSVTLSASDNPGGSGVASVTYSLDGIQQTALGASTTVSVPASPNGHHTLTYWATDEAANSCTQETLLFTIDTVGPVTCASATSGRVGCALSLRYEATDNLSPLVVQLRLVVLNSHGEAINTLRIASRKVGTWYTARWTPKAKGLYRYRIYATDEAGNAQRLLGTARARVV